MSSTPPNIGGGSSDRKRKRDEHTPYKVTTRRLKDGRKIELIDLTTTSPPELTRHGGRPGLVVPDRGLFGARTAVAQLPVQRPARLLDEGRLKLPNVLPMRSCAADEDIRSAHARIDSIAMPPTHRIILKWVSYIPSGSWSSYPHLRDWIKLHTTNPGGIRSVPTALSKSYSEYGLSLHEVPVHRFVNSGAGTTDWGNHLSEVYNTADRQRLLGEEGCRFDCNGRILGSAFSLGPGHELEEIVGSENGDNAQARRLHAASQACDAAKSEGWNPKSADEWLALSSGERMLMYNSGYQWVSGYDYC